MTKGQEEFRDQMTRKLLVEWCYKALKQGSGDGSEITIPRDIFYFFASTKKWISTGSPNSSNIDEVSVKILSGGWDTAARFLKR